MKYKALATFTDRPLAYREVGFSFFFVRKFISSAKLPGTLSKITGRKILNYRMMAQFI